jgi:hypothetical protein
LLRQLLRRFGVPLAFYGDHSGIFVRNDDGWTVDEQLTGKRQPTQFGRALQQLGVTFIAANSPVLRKNLVGITPQSFEVDIRDAVRPGPTSS